MEELKEHELSILSGISLFKVLGEEELRRLLARMQKRNFASKEVIYHSQDLPSGLFILLEGEAKTRIVLPDDRQITFHIFRKGNYFGMHSLLSDGKRSTDAVAVTACKTLFFPRNDFLGFLDEHPEASRELLRVMAAMYRTSVERMRDLALLDVRTRIAKELLHLASGIQASGPEGCVKLSLSQNEVASLIGATRESTNKWLRYFENEGLLRLQRGTISVLDTAGLAAELEDD